VRLYLKFPGGSWTDYTDYLIYDSIVINERLMNDECKSTVDTCSFKLKYDSTLQAALFTATDWIECQLRDDFGPVAHYAFERNARDSTVNAYNGTISGASYTTAGHRNGCLSFDGVDNYVSLPSGVCSVFDEASPWTIIADAKLDTLTPADASSDVMSLYDGATQVARIFYRQSTGLWRVLGYDGTLLINGPEATTNWTHLCAEFDGSTVTFEIDGAVVGTDNNVTTTGLVADAGNIGGNGATPTGYSFDGLIDEVYIYNKTLTAAEKAAHFNGLSGPVFRGVIAPTFGLRKKTNVLPIQIEAQDMSYLLDRPINTSFNYPATIGGTAYQIFNADDSSNNVVWELLEDAGYTPASDIASVSDDITTTVEYFQGTDGDETYREYIDDLLNEHGWVFRFTEFGEFTVYQWDKDSLSSTATIDEDMEIAKRNHAYDGFEVEFAHTAVDTDALLYRDDLPVGQDSDGNYVFTGQAIASYDVYPPDGDIDTIYQNYVLKWLDKPYLSRWTRLKNKDLSLIAADASDDTLVVVADPGVVVASSTYEKKRATVLFQNLSGATANIYSFSIRGTALYRKSRRKTLCPNTATNPQKYVARFLHNVTRATVQTNASRFARAKSRMLINGSYKYMWADRTEKAVGAIVTVNMSNPSVNQTVVIVERRYNPERTTYDYTARGISAYSATTVANSGDAPDVAPTQPQQIADLSNTNLTGNSTSIGTRSATNAVGVPVTRAVQAYLGYQSGDHGQGLYIKEWNGTGWEVRGRVSVRDPSTWLAVDDMSHSMSIDNVELS
jgi:hypothetical protein